jgi:hypothetical protein
LRAKKPLFGMLAHEVTNEKQIIKKMEKKEGGGWWGGRRKTLTMLQTQLYPVIFWDKI